MKKHKRHIVIHITNKNAIFLANVFFGMYI